MIRGAGFIGANYGGADKMALVSPIDSVTAAAEEFAKLVTGCPSEAGYFVTSQVCTLAGR